MCYFSGAQVRDIARKLPCLVCPSGNYRLLIIQAGSDEVAERSLRVIKRNFRALVQRGRRPAWLNRKLILRFQEKKRVYLLWKKGQKSWGEYKKVASIYREKIGKAKNYHELYLAPSFIGCGGEHDFLN